MNLKKGTQERKDEDEESAQKRRAPKRG